MKTKFYKKKKQLWQFLLIVGIVFKKNAITPRKFTINIEEKVNYTCRPLSSFFFREVIEQS